MFWVESRPNLHLGNVKCFMSISHVSPRWVPWGMCPTLTVQRGMRDISTRTLEPIDNKAIWNQQSEMQAQAALAQIHKIPLEHRSTGFGSMQKQVPSRPTWYQRPNGWPFTSQGPWTEPFHSSAQIGPYIFEEWPPNWLDPSYPGEGGNLSCHGVQDGSCWGCGWRRGKAHDWLAVSRRTFGSPYRT